MTRKDKTQIAAELTKLKDILIDTNNTDLWQRLEDSESKKALLDTVDFAVKSLEAQVDNLTLSVPEKIARSLFKGKPGLHFDLTPKNNTTAKPFDFSVISRKFTQLLHGES